MVELRRSFVYELQELNRLDELARLKAYSSVLQIKKEVYDEAESAMLI